MNEKGEKLIATSYYNCEYCLNKFNFVHGILNLEVDSI
jgi:hypothetical protein